MPVTVTYDLEDHRPPSQAAPRFIANTHRLMEVLAGCDARATVFVVGELARDHPALVRELHGAGHEIALHGWRHVPFGEIGRGNLAEELRRGRVLLEDITGDAVTGVRAPIFSLTKTTAWAVEELAEAGFGYSSSVLPAANPQHGWPGAPRIPYRWSNGLVEVPCPLLGAGPVQVPAFGGAYVRYVPRRILGAACRSLGARPGAWTYLHPYDIDAEEPFAVMPWAGWAVSRIVLGRRREAIARLRLVIERAGGPGPPLREISAALPAGTVTRDPRE